MPRPTRHPLVHTYACPIDIENVQSMRLKSRKPGWPQITGTRHTVKQEEYHKERPHNYKLVEELDQTRPGVLS